MREQRRTQLIGLQTTSTDKSEIDRIVAELLGDFNAKQEAEQQVNQEDNEAPKQVEEQYKPSLVASEYVQFDIQPKEIQTDVVEEPTQIAPVTTTSLEIKENIAETKESAVENIQVTQAEPQKPRELGEDELYEIVESESFKHFLSGTSRIVERALNDYYDYTIDYALDDRACKEDSLAAARDVVSLKCVYKDDRLTHSRSVTSLSSSSRYPELSLASYNKSQVSNSDPDGLVMIWNQHLVDRPEYVFHSQSEVLCAQFCDFNPTLVIGGTYSGQILLWDTRHRSLPVLKTTLSSGHSHPITSLKLSGSQTSHSLVTASSDGLICSWNLDMLTKPQESLELLHSQHSKTDQVSITCLDIPKSDTSSFLIGTEEGNAYSVNRHDRAGIKAGLVDTYAAHSDWITGLSAHPSSDFSDIFVTSSVDWSISLWKALPLSSKPGIIRPLHTLTDLSCYVTDVHFSPVHPSVFAAIDTSGKLLLYNLNLELEHAIHSVQVSEHALNKLSWSKDAKRIVVGDVSGSVFVYDVSDAFHVSNDDWTLFQRTLWQFESA